MKKANLTKQTTFTLFFTILFFPLLLLAQPPSCDQIYDKISGGGYDHPVNSTLDEVCEFVDNLYVGNDPDCPTPTNVKSVVTGNSIFISWDPVLPPPLRYRIDYINTTTGVSGYVTTDFNQITLSNLPSGLYIFALRTECSNGIFSDPSIFVESLGPIIVDIIGALSEPGEPSDCYCENGSNPASYSQDTTTKDYSWPGTVGKCGVEKYQVQITVDQVNPKTLDFTLTRTVSGNQTFFDLYLCDVEEIILVSTSSPSSFVGAAPDNSVDYFRIDLSDAQMIVTPTSNGPSTYGFGMTITPCCRATDVPANGGGSKKGEKGENSGKNGRKWHGGNQHSGGPSAGLSDHVQILTAPNPFLNETMIYYTLTLDSPMSLNLYNALGQQVLQIKNGFYPAGTYQIPLEGEGLRPGLYYLHLKSNTQDEMIKIMKLR